MIQTYFGIGNCDALRDDFGADVVQKRGVLGLLGFKFQSPSTMLRHSLRGHRSVTLCAKSIYIGTSTA